MQLSGYLINEKKFELMKMYTTGNMEREVVGLSEAVWKEKEVRYFWQFGLSSAKECKTVYKIRNQLQYWDKLTLPWFGWIAAIKMKILPQFLFLFQNLLDNIPIAVMSESKSLLKRFLCTHEDLLGAW